MGVHKAKKGPRAKMPKAKEPITKGQAGTCKQTSFCLCLQHSRNAFLCRQSYVTQEGCSMRANYAADDAVLTMHMGVL